MQQEERQDDYLSIRESYEGEGEGEEEDNDEYLDEPSMERSMSKAHRALAEFREKVEHAILHNYLVSKESNGGDKGDGEDSKDVKLWGVPLLPSAGHAGTDAVLMKYLKKKNFKVKKAFILLQNALQWRAEFWPNGEDSRSEEGTNWFSYGRDKEGRPLCYAVLGRESRRRFMTAGDGNRHQDYLKWRIQCVEKGIESLDFSPGRADSFIQIIDLKNALLF